MVKKNCKWECTDWSDLKGTVSNEWGDMIGYKDVSDFATEAMVLASLDTGIDMLEIIERNGDFYSQLRQMFEIYDCVDEENPQLMRIQQSFVVPISIPK